MTDAQLDKLRQAAAWARTFLNEAQNALIDEPNNHRRAASQLMELLAEVVVTDR